MNNNDEELIPTGQLRVMQIIAAALLLGVSAFLAVAIFQASNLPPQAADDSWPILGLLAGAMLLSVVPLSIVLSRTITRNALQQMIDGTWKAPEEGNPQLLTTFPAKLLIVRQTTLIIELAMLEAPAFLGCIAYMTTARLAILAVPVIVISLMLSKFPTEARIRAWLAQQADVLTDLKRLKDTRPN